MFSIHISVHNNFKFHYHSRPPHTHMHKHSWQSTFWLKNKGLLLSNQDTLIKQS